MNAIQPAAHVRAVTGFRDSRAGTRSIAHCAWNRSLLWVLVRFLPVVILCCLSITPAHADGVSGTITNGKTVSGTVTGSGHDDYSFSPAKGATFVVSLGEAGSHDQHFVPQLEVIPPGAKDGPSEARPYYTNRQVFNAAAGTWTLRVSRLDSDGSSGGTYALKLAVTGGGTPLSGGEKSGTNTRGAMDVFTFSGSAGKTARLTLNPTSGKGFIPEVYVFGPDGAQVSDMWCASSCSFDVPTTNGTYTVTALKHDDNDVEGTYTLAVGNAN